MTESSPKSTIHLLSSFSWVFSTPPQAFRWTIALMTAWGGILTFVRCLSLPEESIYWTHELTLLAPFCYAIFLSLRLALGFFQLQEDLRGKNKEMDALLNAQRATFHRRRWLVLMPLLLGAFATSLRFIAAEGFRPFSVSTFEYF